MILVGKTKTKEIKTAGWKKKESFKKKGNEMT